MATTISGTTVTFTDGSTWGGATPSVPVDNNSSRQAVSYQVGYLAFGNTVFLANQGNYGTYYVPGNIYFGLNTSSFWKSNTGVVTSTGNNGIGVNYVYGANTQDYGSQCFYMAGNVDATYATAGTWKFRGQAVAKGINQDKGNFALAERVA